MKPPQLISVRELIEKLQEFQPDLLIKFYCPVIRDEPGNYEVYKEEVKLGNLGTDMGFLEIHLKERE